MKKLIGTVVLLASTSTAFASGEQVEWAAEYVKAMKTASPGRYRRDVTECAQSVKEARDAKAPIAAKPIYKDFGGAPVDDHGYAYQITYEQADAICRDAAFLSDVVYKDMGIFVDLDSKIDTLVRFDWNMGAKDSMPTDYLTQLVPACEKAVADLEAAKVPATTPFVLDHTGVATVGDLKKKLCDRAKDLGANYWKHREDDAVKAKAPYLKAGIKGDKLDLMLEYSGSLFLAGKRAPTGLKPYAAASTMFSWSTSDPDDNDYVVHTVRKYMFKGNTLVKTSEKTYRTRRGENLGASAFK